LVAGELREAVKAAIDADQIRREATSHRKALLARFATLTPREREVMALVTRGLLNKQVAGDLGLSEITVKVHRGSAMRKMAARTLADLVRMADAIARPEPGPGAWRCLNGLRMPRSN
jgi:FixJ family two-component response regulator